METPNANDGQTPPENQQTPPKPEENKGNEGQNSGQESQNEGGKGSGDQPKMVQISEEELNQIRQGANRASNLEKKLKRITGKQKNTVKKEVDSFDLETPPEENEDENEAQGADNAQQQEYAKMQNFISSAIIDNSDYGEVLRQNPTLRRVIANDPLALLTTEERDDLHFAEDGVDKVKAFLDNEVSKMKKEHGAPAENKPKGKEFQAGPANPPGQPPVEPTEKDNRTSLFDKGKKEGGVKGVAKMIRAQIRK